MKKLKNTIKYFLPVLFFLFFIILPVSVSAAGINFTPQVTIPGGPSGEIGENSIGLYIKAIYKYAIGIVGILATVVMMIGGFLWLTAGGNSGQVTEAQEWIKASLTGLIIALCSYLILATVNPALVNFQPIKVPGVVSAPAGPSSSAGISGCCQGYCASATDQSTCDSKGGSWQTGATFNCGADTTSCVKLTNGGGCCRYDKFGISYQGCTQTSSENLCKSPTEGINQCKSDPTKCDFTPGKKCYNSGTSYQCVSL